MKNKFYIWLLITILFFIFRFIYLGSVNLTHIDTYSVITLIMCTFFLWNKKDHIIDEINNGYTPKIFHIFLGLILIFFSFLLPFGLLYFQFELFSMLVLLIGIFMIFYGNAAKYPFFLLMIYGISIYTPVLINQIYGTHYAIFTTFVVGYIISLFYPISFMGQKINFINTLGINTTIFIDAACSGSASIAIFLTVFALMILDIRPKFSLIIPIFLFGIIGTSIQNILRLILLFVANYYFGENLMWILHSYAGYILFPIWFIVFIYIYLKITKKYPSEFN